MSTILFTIAILAVLGLLAMALRWRRQRDIARLRADMMVRWAAAEAQRATKLEEAGRQLEVFRQGFHETLLNHWRRSTAKRSQVKDESRTPSRKRRSRAKKPRRIQ